MLLESQLRIFHVNKVKTVTLTALLLTCQCQNKLPLDHILVSTVVVYRLNSSENTDTAGKLLFNSILCLILLCEVGFWTNDIH